MLKNSLFTLIIVGLTSLTFLPLLHSGFFAFHDNTQVERVYEMGVVLSEKIIPVRIVPDLGYGYGYPIFNYYAPLPYYLGGIIMNAGFDPLLATKAMIVVGILISGISMFFMARRFFGDAAGIVSAVVYSYFPYHAVNIFVRGAVDEFFAYAFLPIVFLGLFQLVDLKEVKIRFGKHFSSVINISLGIFLVSISHNLSIFMLLVLLVPFMVVSLFFVKQKKNFLVLSIGSVLLGLVLSSFYIIPAFAEMSFTNVASQVGGGANFTDHFVCLQQFINSPWGFGGSAKGCVDGLSFSLGKVNILLFGLGIVLLAYSIVRKKTDNNTKFAILSFVLLLISIFLTLSQSGFVWQTIPFMKYIQYPWRFLNFIGMFASFIAGYVVFKTKERFGFVSAVAFSAIVVLMVIVTEAKLFVPQSYNNYPPAFYVKDSNLKYTVSKISDEYLPSGFQVPRSPAELPSSKVELLKTTGNIGVLESSSNYLKTSYQIQGDGVAHVNLAYFPGWKAYVNNVEQTIVPTSKGMNVSLVQGNGIFEMKLTQTNIEIIADFLTVIAFLALLIGIIKNGLTNK